MQCCCVDIFKFNKIEQGKKKEKKFTKIQNLIKLSCIVLFQLNYIRTVQQNCTVNTNKRTLNNDNNNNEKKNNNNHE